MTNQKSFSKPTAKLKSNSEAGLCLSVFRLASLPYSSFIKSSFNRCPFQILESCSCNSIKVFLSWCIAWLSEAFLEPWPTDFYHYRRRKLLKIPNRRRKASNDFTIRFFSLEPRPSRNSTRDLSWLGTLTYGFLSLQEEKTPKNTKQKEKSKQWPQSTIF